MSNKNNKVAPMVLPPIKQSGEATQLPANDEPPLPGERPLAKEGEPAPLRVKFQAACGNCKCFMANNGIRPKVFEDFAKTAGQCRANPPIPVVVGMAQSITGQPRPVVDGFFTPVHGAIWCTKAWEPCDEAIEEAWAAANAQRTQGNA